MAKKAYVSTGTLQMGRIMHPAGARVDLEPADAQGLLARGAIAEVSAATAAAASNEGFDVSEGTRKLLPKVAASTSLLALKGLLDAERAREGGPRQSVLDAIEARGAALMPARDEGEDEDDAGEGPEA